MNRAALVVALSALMTTACFGSEEPTPASTPARSGDRVPVAVPVPVPAAAPPTAPVVAQEKEPTSLLSLVLHNRSAETVSVLRVGQQTPLWLEIDGGVALTGYGANFCGGDKWSHNDPFFTLQPIPAGGTEEIKWWAAQVSFSGDCWSSVPLAPGKHTGRACSYAKGVGFGGFGGIPTGPAPVLPASKWFETAPTHCTEFAFELPATGAVTIDIDL